MKIQLVLEYFLIEGNVQSQTQPIDTNTSQYYYHSAHVQLKISIILETNKPYKRKTSAQTGAVKAPAAIAGALVGLQVGTMV